MKRTCNDCMANLSMDGEGHGCSLHFKIDILPDPRRPKHTIQAPAEECPKPLTIKKFVELCLAKDQRQEVI
jgi:hypothetical protein